LNYYNFYYLNLTYSTSVDESALAISVLNPGC